MSDSYIDNTQAFIQEEWMKLAQAFFPNDDISTLKTSTFGYINEIMSNEIKNSVYHRNFVFDEHLLNTASTAKSIYNFAKSSEVSIDFAKPATVSINLSLRKSDIVNSGQLKQLKDNVYQYVISKDTVFTVKEYSFMLPYDVLLMFTRNSTGEDQSVVALYDTSKTSKFDLYDIEDSYIKTWETNVENEDYIFLKVDLFQLTLYEKTVLITNEDASSNTFYKFSFDKQLTYFEIYYKEKADSELELITPIFNNSYSLLDGEKYCYYNLDQEGVLEISFTSLFNSFRPVYGSKLIAKIYTTEGAAANVTTNSNVNVMYNQGSGIETIPMFIQTLTDCHSGKDAPSLIELKKKIIDKNLVRNILVTDNDLNKYFNNLSKTQSINNSSITFLKRRNDVLRRIYTAFLLLKDTSNYVVPTRTLDKLRISGAQLKEINNTIPERSIVAYDIKDDTYFLITRELELSKFKDNENYLLYSIPYLIKVNSIDEQKENQTVSHILNSNYYKTFVNKDLVMKYKYVNPEIPYKFILNTVSIYRNSLQTDVYKIVANLNTNLSLNSINTKNLILRGIIRNKAGEAYGFFDFKRSSANSLSYEANLATEKYKVINDEGKLNLYNCINKIDALPIIDENGNTNLSNCYVEEDLYLDIQIIFKSNLSGIKFEEAASMPDLISSDINDQYCSATVFTSNSPINLHKNMSNIIDSLITPLTDNGVIIHGVPLVEYSYFHNNTDSIFGLLENYMLLLESNLNKLESNTEIDMKFYNTHGKSKLLYSGVVNGQKQYTSRIDIHLDIDIYLNYTISEYDKIEIEEFIADFIESCNDNGAFPISNLCRKLEDKFPIIQFIEFNSMNGDKVQKILNSLTVNEIIANPVKDYVPEYMNLRKNLSIFEADGSSEKTYKYDLTINYK